MTENRLKAESSPYLQQHKNNPVDWYPWGVEAFTKAKDENKPIFLSIGYSTCYWCHVMEKDSFEHDDVAELLNKWFVPIKVDREERPDVDQLYMDAVTALHGHGGWPLSVFLTPDLKPFWGGTFFYKDQFKKILGSINNNWTEKHKEVELAAGELVSFISGKEAVKESEAIDKESLLKICTQNLKNSFDKEWGGFGRAPKFPPSQVLSYLLRVNKLKEDKELILLCSYTLEKMAEGGIFDHVGGGFHRYATDEKWRIPHFEKMLYDNALISLAYSEAYQVTRNINYLNISKRILDFVSEELLSPEGGFYSALDAGEVNKEGEYYVWAFDELKDLLKDKFEKFKEVYEISQDGNFEGKNIIYLKRNTNLSEIENFKEELKLLKKYREKRSSPLRDEKIITSWNGLIIKALCEFYIVSNNDKYLLLAVKAANFLKVNLNKDGRLGRSYRGSVSGVGCLEDYAFLIDGLFSLYKITLDELWLDWASDLQDQQDKRFWESKEGIYITSDAPELFTKNKETYDNALPSGNSISYRNLLRWFELTADLEFKRKANSIFLYLTPFLKKYPQGIPSLLQEIVGEEFGRSEIITKDEKLILKSQRDKFLPFSFFAKPRKESKFLLLNRDLDPRKSYVCKSSECREIQDNELNILDL